MFQSLVAHPHAFATEGFAPVITHIFAAGDPYLDSDAVFGVRNSPIAPFPLEAAGVAPDTSVRAAPYYAVSWDFILRRAEDDVTHFPPTAP